MGDTWGCRCSSSQAAEHIVPITYMAKIISRIMLVLCILALCGCNLQRNMLYYPTKTVPSKASLSAYNLQFWPSDLKDYRGFINILTTGQPKGTIIVFHGNAGTAADRVYYVNALTRLGFRVILAEYPGYGKRTGKMGEESFVLDAKETMLLAFEQYGAPIYLLGESLGCGVAAAAAKDSLIKSEGILLITPWDSLLSVAKEKFTWFPVRLFLRDRYDTIDNLKEYQGRIIVVGAERDEVIPIQHAEALFRSLPGSPKFYMIKGAGHNDWPERVSLGWWKEAMDLMEKHDR